MVLVTGGGGEGDIIEEVEAIREKERERKRLEDEDKWIVSLPSSFFLLVVSF